MVENRKYLLVALGLAILIRGIIFSQIYPDVEIISTSDQSKYIRLAEYLTLNKNYGMDFGSSRMPVYPAFISICETVVNSLFFVLIIQNIIGLSILYIGYQVGMLFSERIALYTTFFSAINLNFILESNLILTESIFYPLFGFFILLLLKYLLKGEVKLLIFAGLVLGFCTLIRPVTMYMPVFVMFALLFRSGTAFFKKVQNGFIFLLFFFLMISPWLCRNYILYDYPGLTSQGRAHIIGYVMPYVMQYEDKINQRTAKEKTRNLWLQERETLPDSIISRPFKLDQKAKEFGYSYLLSAKYSSIAKAWFWGAMKNIFSPVTVELSFILNMDRTTFHESEGKNVPEQLVNFIFLNKNKTYSLLMLFGLTSIMVLRLLQLVGLWNLFKLNRPIFFACLIIIIYFLIVSGPIGYAKYRIPFELLLALFSAIGFDVISKNLPWQILRVKEKEKSLNYSVTNI